MKRNMIGWLVASFIITVIFGTIYAAVQQSLRSAANDPQIQMAEDIGAQIDNGSDPKVFANVPVDVASSLAPFVIIYDKSGQEVISSAQLGEASPKLPKGVLDNAKPQNSVTWEPKDGVRIAAVVQATNNGYVLAGRNMREVEQREDYTLQFAAAGWILSEVALTGFVSYKALGLKTASKKSSRTKK